MPGPVKPRSTRSRVERLEADVAALTREVRGAGRRPARWTWPVRNRLAITTHSYEAYPSEPANTFEVEFVDGGFAESAGWNAAAYTPRGPIAYAHAKGGEYFPEGAYVDVQRRRRQWWLLGISGAIARAIDFTLTSHLTGGASSAAASVDAYYNGTTPGATCTVYSVSGDYGLVGQSGIAIFDDRSGKYKIASLGSATGTSNSIFWGRTQANWTKNGTDPRISCKQVTGTPGRTSSTVSGSTFWVYLPRTIEDGDPNVVSGTNIQFALDQDGSAVAVGDYLDATILTIRYWSGDVADIPAGWAIMNGVANSNGNGGSGIVMVDPGYGYQYFPLPTNVDAGGGDGAVGSTTNIAGKSGAATGTVTAHSVADIEAVLDNHSLGGITADATDIDDHTGYSSGSGTANIPAHTLATQASSTGCAFDDALVHVSTTSDCVEGAYPEEVADVVDYESLDDHTSEDLNAAFNDPQHSHVVTGLQTHVDAGHVHTVPTMAHTGSLSLGGGDLAHTVLDVLTHDPLDLWNPFKNLVLIERIDNSV